MLRSRLERGTALPCRPHPILLVLLSLSVAPACSEGDCAECVDEKCSELMAICERDEDCGCVGRCLRDEGVPGVDGCLDDCGLSARPASFLPLEQCVAVGCPDTDECSTPGDYTAGKAESPSDDAGVPLERLAGGDLADCSFDADRSYEPDGTVLQLQSESGEVCVRLERRNEGAGSMANTRWSLLDIRVGPLGGIAQVKGGDDACWYSSHHNFQDLAHVWTGSRRFDLELAEDGHGGARSYILHSFEQGPLDGTCSPLPDGTGRIGGPLWLRPFSP